MTQTPALTQQPALFHGPGRFSALCVFQGTGNASALRAAAAKLLQVFSNGNNLPDELYVLVALSPRVLEGHRDFQNLAADVPQRAARGFPFDNNDLFVQVAAQSDVHRLFALRLIVAVVGTAARLVREVMGGRILNWQEPFGFRESSSNGQDSTIESLKTSNDSGVWLLYQRFEQDLIGFATDNPTATSRGQVIGRAPVFVPDETPNNTAEERRTIRTRVAAELAMALPPDSHYALMRPNGQALPMVRRGFPCRHEGTEGIAFVGVAKDPSVFSATLDRMRDANGQALDRLMRYANALEGGMYFCPPAEPTWLDEAAGALPAFPTDPLEHAQHLISYDTTSGFIQYLMKLRELGIFDVKGRPTAISDKARPRLDDLYRTLEEGHQPSLVQLEQTAIKNAADVNADDDEYITFG